MRHTDWVSAARCWLCPAGIHTRGAPKRQMELIMGCVQHFFKRPLFKEFRIKCAEGPT